MGCKFLVVNYWYRHDGRYEGRYMVRVSETNGLFIVVEARSEIVNIVFGSKCDRTDRI